MPRHCARRWGYKSSKTRTLPSGGSRSRDGDRWEITTWSGDTLRGVAHVERTPDWREGDLKVVTWSESGRPPNARTIRGYSRLRGEQGHRSRAERNPRLIQCGSSPEREKKILCTVLQALYIHRNTRSVYIHVYTCTYELTYKPTHTYIKIHTVCMSLHADLYCVYIYVHVFMYNIH